MISWLKMTSKSLFGLFIFLHQKPDMPLVPGQPHPPFLEEAQPAASKPISATNDNNLITFFIKQVQIKLF
ncbi:MAG TPA: hypothetical protein DEU93_03320 [Chitinophagaceae bacterium]|nr:hypothetical protein [Chitinophagaceae bacterium]